MAYREVSVTVIREGSRLWLRGEGLPAIERGWWLDRKTVRRYVHAAVDVGLMREADEEQLTAELLGRWMPRRARRCG